MYRNNNTEQGCIIVKVRRIPDKIKTISGSLNTATIINTKLLNKLIVHTNHLNDLNSHLTSIYSRLFILINKQNEDINMKCNNHSSIKVKCGIVCSKNELNKVLTVSPNLIFLSKSNNFTDDVYIISNVVWDIN